MSADLYEILSGFSPSADELAAALALFPAETWRRARGFYVGGVAFGDGFFEPGGETRAWILQCFEFGELVDLVAVDIARPSKFEPLRGSAWGLGTDDAGSISARCAQDDLGEALRVWRTPWRWLHAGARGVVIFDWSVARAELFEVMEIVGESPAHGAAIEKLMQPPPWRGTVLVPRPDSMVIA